MSEVFCSSYPLKRRPPVQRDVEKLPGQVHCCNLGLTVPTGNTLSGTITCRRCLQTTTSELRNYTQDALGGEGTRKAKPHIAEPPQMQLMTELAASDAAQAVQQLAAATDWPCITDLLHYIAWDVAPQKPNSLAHADITKGTEAVCSTKVD